MIRTLRHIASTAVALSTLLVLLPTSTTACGDGTCSEEEQSSCHATHTSCVDKCGDGTVTDANGVPSPDPAYSGCVEKCDDNLCTCLDDCGSTCNGSEGNL